MEKLELESSSKKIRVRKTRYNFIVKNYS